MRTTTLFSNIVLLIATFASLFWAVDASMLFTGVAIGIVLSAPSVLALVSPDRIPFSVLIKINLSLMVVVSALAVVQLYVELLQNTGQPVVGLIVTLFFALALCGSMQLLIFSAGNTSVDRNPNSLLHRAYSGPSLALTLTIGIIATGMLQSLIFALSDSSVFFTVLKAKLIERGIIPYLCLILFFWGLLLLLGNFFLVRIEQRQVDSDLHTGLDKAQSASCLSLLDLITSARCGSSRTKKLACVDQMTDIIWNKTEYMYTVPRYINWAIPILGFIGTVLGISLAAESIGGLISSPESNFSTAIGDAIAPLGIAFDTTLVALTLSVALMLLQTLMQRWQERSLQAMEQKLRDTI